MLGLCRWVIVLPVDDVQQQFAIVWGCVDASDFIYVAGFDEGLARSQSWINTVDRGFQSSYKYLDTDSSLICSSVRCVIVTIPCQRGSDWAKWCLKTAWYWCRDWADTSFHQIVVWISIWHLGFDKKTSRSNSQSYYLCVLAQCCWLVRSKER